MYKQYLKSSLTPAEITHANKNAPENAKYCNGICQNYAKNDLFKKNSNVCNNCLNMINLGAKQIKNKIITLENFLENPKIVSKKIDCCFEKRECIICKINKNISDFEGKRNQCQSCRLEINKNRVNKDFDIVILTINQNKNNLLHLKDYLNKLTKDQLVKVVSHFQVGRKSTDTKAIILDNIVNFFQKQLDSDMCPGGCDRKAVEKNVKCGECIRKEKIKKKKGYISMPEFMKNILPDILETLTEPISAENYNTYNREQLCKIARKFGCKINTKIDKKETVIAKINKVLEERKNTDKPKNFLLYLSDLDKNVEVFIENNMFDGTSLCIYGEKKFSKYKETVRYKKLFKKLKKENDDEENIIIRKYKKSWICKELAIDVANWISKDFEKQIKAFIEDNMVVKILEEFEDDEEDVENDEEDVENDEDVDESEDDEEAENKDEDVDEIEDDEETENKDEDEDEDVDEIEDDEETENKDEDEDEDEIDNKDVENEDEDEIDNKEVENDEDEDVDEIEDDEETENKDEIDNKDVENEDVENEDEDEIDNKEVENEVEDTEECSENKNKECTENKKVGKNEIKIQPKKELINSDNFTFKDFNLLLSNGKNFKIPVREDGYVNVTLLCKANGKRIDKWKENKDSKKLLKDFKSIPHFCGIDPLSVIKGGNLSNINQGTFAHPDIAIQIAQWCSSSIALQVSRWIRELLVNGKVELGKEKSNKELERILIDKIKRLENKVEETYIEETKKYKKLEKTAFHLQKELESEKENYKKLEKKHNKILKKRQYHKFKEGPGIYIFSTTDEEYKIGMESVSLNRRLQEHRTTCPNLKLHYIVYTEDCAVLEKCILSKFGYAKLYENHEILIDIPINMLIDGVETIINICNFKSTIVPKEEIEKYNNEL